MMDIAAHEALPEPKLSDEVAGELMCIEEDLARLTATFQLVLDGPSRSAGSSDAESPTNPWLRFLCTWHQVRSGFAPGQCSLRQLQP